MAINEGTVRGAKHGTWTGYSAHGCRCKRCRKASASQYTMRAGKRKSEIYSGHCAICGSTENLQRDHLDPTSKNFDIARNITVSKERLEAEVALTQLLCAECHRQKAGIYRLPNGEWATLKDVGRKSVPEGTEYLGQSYTFLNGVLIGPVNDGIQFKLMFGESVRFEAN